LEKSDLHKILIEEYQFNHTNNYLSTHDYLPSTIELVIFSPFVQLHWWIALLFIF